MSNTFQSRNRRRERYGEIGIQREDFIADILEKSGKFIKVVHHKKYSWSDLHGKDFTCYKIIDDKCVSISFGVTISRRSWMKARIRHPKITQIHFPINTKPETIIKRVDSLFVYND
ncbi:MAG TPA: hypothetical protein PLA41_02990 [Candidatus Pacearchaeota archaeon]|nr:hypothetical protein [Candidatus Parcubacteria bacterium]HNZ84131.1 hypothetical protein [Candidatus Pacearchaeota archaeon]HOU46087.1 hypothetical protein [Candidatus Pacearchaeota archaeon]HPM08630.1 hypothetical protein [Candidatus Pacearchaeota archaeon]HQI74852.1 hypothetical protein [Candidatus Pacearchaeota archaeon]